MTEREGVVFIAPMFITSVRKFILAATGTPTTGAG